MSIFKIHNIIQLNISLEGNTIPIYNRGTSTKLSLAACFRDKFNIPTQNRFGVLQEKKNHQETQKSLPEKNSTNDTSMDAGNAQLDKQQTKTKSKLPTPIEFHSVASEH